MNSGVLPEWISTPVRAALRDLHEAGEPEIAVEWRPEDDDSGVLAASGTGESKRFSRDSVTPANVAVEVADWFQKQVIPKVAGARAGTRPVCPGHDHPMQAKNVYAVAWWACPTSDSLITLVGER